VNWNDGTAVSYAMQIQDLERFPLPARLIESIQVSSVMTYGTLAVELSLGVLVWKRTLRPWVLLIGVGMHLGIDYSIRVGFFSFAIFAAYLAFVTPEAAERVILWARGRLQRLRGRDGEPAPARAA